MSKPELIAVFDLETTGVDVYEDRIVTAFIGLMTPEGELIEKYSYLVNPGVEIPQGATDVHGITNELVQAEGRFPNLAVTEITTILKQYQREGIPIAGYNLAYDFTLLKYEALRYELEPFIPTLVIDGFVLDKALDKYRKGKRTLSVTSAHYGIDIGDNAHNAEADCIAAGKLAYILLEKLKLPVGEVHHRTVQWAHEQAESLQAYFRRLDPDAVVDGTWPIRKDA